MDDDSRTVKASVDAVFEQTGTARNTARTARRELEKAGRLSSTAGTGRGHLTLWTVHCLPGKGVSDVDPLSRESKGVNGIDPLPDEKGVKPTTERGSIGPEKEGQPESADLQKRDRGLNRRANPSPPAPPTPLRPHGVAGVQAGEGESSPTANDVEELVEEAHAAAARAHKDWTRTAIRNVLNKPEVREHSWQDTRAALLILAADDATYSPGRLASPGRWWAQAKAQLRTPSRPSRMPVCETCHGSRRLADPVTGEDAGKCPDCHPALIRSA